MGIPEVAAKLKQCAGPKKKVSNVACNFPARTVVGLDMNCKMNAFARSVRGAEEYHMKPAYPAHYVANSCLQYIRKYQKLGVGVFAVFDGLSRSSLKAPLAKSKRDDPRATAQAKLDQLLRTPYPSTIEKQKDILSEIGKQRRRSACVNDNTRAEVMRVLEDNGIPFIVAPIEADWQLAYMYIMGFIHAIDTTDSDYWALIKDPCLLLNVNTSDLKGHICYGNQCLLIGQSRSIQDSDASRDEPFHHMTQVGTIIRATIYGNDYHKGCKGVDKGTLEPLMTKYANDIDGLVQYLSRTYNDFLPASMRRPSFCLTAGHD